jgi:hypothetical protein
MRRTADKWEDAMAVRKVLEKVKIRKPLPVYGAETLPVGTEIQLTEDWETTPFYTRARVILDADGDRRLVLEQDLEYALGAH